jgi:hypothetical protein
VGDAVIRCTLLGPAACREMTTFAPTGTPGGYAAYTLGVGQGIPRPLVRAGTHTPLLQHTCLLPRLPHDRGRASNESGSTAATLNIAHVLIQTGEHH